MISLAERKTINCPFCGNRYEADLWLIIDADQNPELIEEIRNYTLHEFKCRSCGLSSGHSMTLTLIVRKEAEFPLIGIYADDVVFQSTLSSFTALIEKLIDLAGGDFDKSSLEKIILVTYSELPLVFDFSADHLLDLLQLINETRNLTDVRQVELLSQYYRKLLSILVKEKHPLLWAHSKYGLATALQQIGSGSIAENFEEAIACYHDALTIWSIDRKPIDWANVMYEMTILYQHRLIDDEEDNLFLAIDCARQALKIYELAGDSHKISWATTLSEIGNINLLRTREGKADNIEKAIENFTVALAMLTPAENTEPWVNIKMNLGNAYVARCYGEKSNNIETALTHYQEAAAIASRLNNSYLLAQIRFNQGCAYYNKQSKDRRFALTQAQKYFEEALQFDTAPGAIRTNAVEALERIRLELGRSNLSGTASEVEDLESTRIAPASPGYRNSPFFIRITGHVLKYIGSLGRTTAIFLIKIVARLIRIGFILKTDADEDDQIAESIRLLERIRRLIIPALSPGLWFKLNYRLGERWIYNDGSDPDKRFEHASYYLSEAIKFTAEVSTKRGRTLQLFSDLQFLDRKLPLFDQIKEYIRFQEEALGIFAAEHDLDNQLHCLSMLSQRYFRLQVGDTETNEEQALRYLETARQLIENEKPSPRWISLMNNLSILHQTRLSGDPVDNCNKGINVCLEAIQLLSMEKDAQAWAKIAYELSIGYQRLAESTGDSKGFDTSIAYLTKVIKIVKSDVDVGRWARAMTEMGTAYLGKGFFNKDSETKRAYLMKAMEYYDKSLEVTSRIDMPDEWRRNVTNRASAQRLVEEILPNSKLGSRDLPDELRRRWSTAGFDTPIFQRRDDFAEKLRAYIPNQENVVRGISDLVLREFDYNHPRVWLLLCSGQWVTETLEFARVLAGCLFGPSVEFTECSMGVNHDRIDRVARLADGKLRTKETGVFAVLDTTACESDAWDSFITLFKHLKQAPLMSHTFLILADESDRAMLDGYHNPVTELWFDLDNLQLLELDANDALNVNLSGELPAAVANVHQEEVAPAQSPEIPAGLEGLIDAVLVFDPQVSRELHFKIQFCLELLRKLLEKYEIRCSIEPSVAEWLWNKYNSESSSISPDQVVHDRLFCRIAELVETDKLQARETLQILIEDGELHFRLFGADTQ